jgi:hypothetical protein
MQRKILRSRLCETGQMLVDEAGPGGFWSGRLSSSALGVAVALTALWFDDRDRHSSRIIRGFDWLSANINADGSFGDTPGSPGNVSTSLLVYASMNLSGDSSGRLTLPREKTARYLKDHGIDIHSPDVAGSILGYYKNDHTFSVPILTMCALCGIPGENAFERIPQLPFELLLFPGRFYRALNLNVVSYAIPALAAVGIVIFRHKKSGLIRRVIRHFSIPVALNKLRRMLPESGGYLEAIPLTAFVALSLIRSGYGQTEIARKGISFLENTQREDGSWPVDIDLSTWVTSLSVRAFRSSLDSFLMPEHKKRISGHLRAIQNRTVHPFNGTSPGGWGWTNYAGSVPDGDDTPGAMLALFMLEPVEDIKNEVLAGGQWLLKLQNGDGGFPTFSKGWGKLPFDQSCPDLTGHCLLALSAVIENYRDELTKALTNRFERSCHKALTYLEKHQKADGSWLPLWFGNQFTEKQTNPLYGTAKVMIYLRDTLMHTWHMGEVRQRIDRLVEKGSAFIISGQNDDGGWGGAKSIPGTIEETALAVSALASIEYAENCYRGLEWIDGIRTQKGLVPAPIGLYFASLWYEERLYPVVFYLEALSRVLEQQKQ